MGFYVIQLHKVFQAKAKSQCELRAVKAAFSGSTTENRQVDLRDSSRISKTEL